MKYLGRKPLRLSERFWDLSPLYGLHPDKQKALHQDELMEGSKLERK